MQLPTQSRYYLPERMASPAYNTPPQGRVCVHAYTKEMRTNNEEQILTIVCSIAVARLAVADGQTAAHYATPRHGTAYP